MSRMSPADPSRRHRRLPDLHALEAFVTVCDAGSMALAAQRLGLSQSAVSQAIKGLEKELELKLLDREHLVDQIQPRPRPARARHRVAGAGQCHGR